MVKLDCEIYSHGKRAANTEKQREAIRNCELSDFDLLVREMVQNSLDAALDEDTAKAVTVQFSRDRFDVKAFAKCLGNSKLFPGVNYSKLLLDYVKEFGPPDRYLAIRDIGCTGLDGDVSDKNSRAWKLPFGFFDGQNSNSLTGGANGIGKVVAFRFGIGFVAYYSKTKKGRSRFVVAFMKDGAHNVFPESAMPDGAAWWGKRSRDSQIGVVCAEDDDDISELLGIFNLRPYARGKSGTTTIIPFFDEEACMRREREKFSWDLCPWVWDFDSYVRFCLGQWYAPRLRGDEFVSDPEKIGDVAPYHWGRSLKDMHTSRKDDVMSHKVFALIRELYDVAVGDKEPDSETKRITCPMGNDRPKYGLSFTGKSLGWVAVRKINYKRGEFLGALPVLCSLVPGRVDDENGESFAGRLGTRRGFMLYCRRHGMIISYERDWDDECYSSLPPLQEGEFYVGIFVVDSNSTVTRRTNSKNPQTSSIDVMFRSFEKSDHYGWPKNATFDGVSMVSLLLKKIKKGLADEFRNTGGIAKREPLDRLSVLLGRFVSSSGLGFGAGANPSPDGVGGLPGAGGGYGGSGDGGRKDPKPGNNGLRFQQGSPTYRLENHRTVVTIPVTIAFSQKALNAVVRCGVVQDGSNAILYAEDLSDTERPVRLKSAEVKETDSLASITLNEKDISVCVTALQKEELTVVCQYELIRKDAALALDCRSMDAEGR